MANITRTLTDAKRVAYWAADDRSDMCEHVEGNKSLADAVLCEDDSFGPVGRYIVCSACLEKAQKEEAEDFLFCHDCRTRKPRGETYEWRWYDFYAAQGDEPLVVCKECWGLPAHTARKAQDRADEEEEVHGHKAFVDEYS